MIIVTGAAGFIGSCLVSRLNERGRRDLLLVDQWPEVNGQDAAALHRAELKKKNLEGKSFRDFIDKEAFLKDISQGRKAGSDDVVFHLGACSSTLLQDEAYYERNNFQYTRRLAEWCLSNRVRLIYASSAATYGDGQQGYRDAHDLLPQLKPLNFYAQSKHKFDLWALNEGVLDRMVGLKYFNVFGPNEYHKEDMRSVILKSYPGVAQDGVMALFKSYRPEYADGEQKRDFVYVKDAVEVTLFFMDHQEVSGIFNVGTGEARSWNDCARALFRAVGKPPRIIYKEMPPALRDKYQYFTEADISKLRDAGYDKSFTSLEEAIQDYVGYLADNRHV